MFCNSYDSPVGQLVLTCTDQALTGLYMNRPLPECSVDHPLFRRAAQWLDAYFAGENPEMDILLLPEGTAFQKQVWKLLQDIPYGETRTYGRIAQEVAYLMGKKTMSAQAVGQAVGRNPISILLPCHRVIGNGGLLTGYAGGLDRKIWLLQHEGLYIEGEKVL